MAITNYNVYPLRNNDKLQIQSLKSIVTGGYRIMGRTNARLSTGLPQAQRNKQTELSATTTEDHCLPEVYLIIS